MSRELLKTAIEAARLGASILREHQDSLSIAEVDEKGLNDYVTHIDRLSEDAIISHIRKNHPDHGILAEESGLHSTASTVRWIIDPLDGTTNYIHNYPVYAVSVAAEQEGMVIAGVVIDVTRNEEFSAAHGDGARLNGESIAVSRITSLAKALILTGFPFKAHHYIEDFITVFRELLPATSGIRRAGSAALDLAHVACGRAEGFWEFGLSAWDIAAGALLVEEAGGIVTDVELGDKYLLTGNVLCGNREVHTALHGMIMKHFEEGHFV